MNTKFLTWYNIIASANILKHINYFPNQMNESVSIWCVSSGQTSVCLPQYMLLVTQNYPTQQMNGDISVTIHFSGHSYDKTVPEVILTLSLKQMTTYQMESL